MLTISKLLSASQARTYHKEEFASHQQNYWSRDQRVFSEWQGRLAEKWSLAGPVQDDHFARLAEGLDYNEQLIHLKNLSKLTGPPHSTFPPPRRLRDELISQNRPAKGYVF